MTKEDYNKQKPSFSSKDFPTWEEYRQAYSDWFDNRSAKRNAKVEEIKKDYLERKGVKGSIELNVPEEYKFLKDPSTQQAENLLHEGQHAIQHIEEPNTSPKLGPTKEPSFFDIYKGYDTSLKEHIEGKMDMKPSSKRPNTVEKSYLYHMNPYEREAFEASKRDIDPAYRKKYSRKTETILKKKRKEE